MFTLNLTSEGEETLAAANYLKCNLTFSGIDIISFGSETEPVIGYTFIQHSRSHLVWQRFFFGN